MDNGAIVGAGVNEDFPVPLTRRFGETERVRSRDQLVKSAGYGLPAVGTNSILPSIAGTCLS